MCEFSEAEKRTRLMADIMADKMLKLQRLTLYAQVELNADRMR